MLNLPEWVYSYISKKGCPQCGASMGSSKIISIGIKEHEDNKYSLCFDSLCTNCGIPANTTILTDMEFSAKQLAAEIFTACRDSDSINMHHEYISPYRKKSRKGKKNVRMSSFNKESKNFIDFLNSCDSYVDLLKEIGLTDEEIEKYGYGK
jgi:hypothetical protein